MCGCAVTLCLCRSLTMLVDKSPFSLVADDEALSRQSARHLQCTLFMACASQAQQGPPVAGSEDSSAEMVSRGEERQGGLGQEKICLPAGNEASEWS